MEEILREEQQEQKENFIVDSDEKAEWAIKKIKDELEERDRLISVCEHMINSYKEKVKGLTEQYDKSTSYLKGQLAEYMQTVKTKKLKASEVYTLPSGKLRKTFPKPQISKDDSILLSWAKENKVNFIKTEEKVQWGELKKALQFDPDTGKAIDEDGLIVEGVTVTASEPEFKVE